MKIKFEKHIEENLWLIFFLMDLSQILLSKKTTKWRRGGSKITDFETT